MTHTTKHTPGPWHIGMKPGPMIYGQNGEQVADCRCNDLLSRDEAQANMTLLKAAPAMYEALGNLLKMVEDGDYTTIELNEARAALAQAEGGTL